MLLLANHCEPHAWRQFNCSNDVLHIVPRAHLAAAVSWCVEKLHRLPLLDSVPLLQRLPSRLSASIDGSPTKSQIH